MEKLHEGSISRVECGDSAELIGGLSPQSIHAVITDPPY